MVDLFIPFSVMVDNRHDANWKYRLHMSDYFYWNRLISEHFHVNDVPCGWLQRRKMQKMLVRKYFDDRLGLSITIKSHGRHVVSNHRSLKCLFNSLCRPISKKHESPHYWPFVGNSSVTAEFPPHRGPVTRKKLTFYDVIMLHVHNTDIFESHP